MTERAMDLMVGGVESVHLYSHNRVSIKLTSEFAPRTWCHVTGRSVSS